MTRRMMRHPKGNRTDGFKSDLEASVFKSLPKRKGVKAAYETHTISYSVPHTYNPDLTITLPSGKIIFIEIKGWFRQEDKVKMRWVKLCNPTLDIRMVFSKKNKKDIRWCEKHGYPYSIGTVPKEWYNG